MHGTSLLVVRTLSAQMKNDIWVSDGQRLSLKSFRRLSLKNPPTPAYSQSLGGEAPGTPQGEAVGQVFKPLGSRPASSLLIAGLPLLFLWASKSDVLAYSCTAALPSSSSRQLAGLPLLFLWASKSDVRHFAPPSNPPPRLQTLPSAFGLLLHRSLACVRREPGERALERAARAPMGFQKNDVRHFAPPSNPPPRLQTLPSALPSPAASNPSQRLWPTPASQPCLRQAGAWGESLWNVQPVHCSPSAFGLLLHRNRSLALLSAAGLPSAAPANPPQRLWPTPAPQPCPLPLLGSSQACLFSSYGLPKATLGTLHRL